MPTHLLTRRRHRSRPALSLMEGVALEHGRVHEACGPARHSFALWLAAAAQDIAPGPVLWLPPPQGGKQLNPDGMAEFASPARFLFLQAARTEDQLWAMEEALRSGAAALVVAELAEPPAITPVRRLHLAAEAGGRFGPAPLGLLLTPGTGGAQGIESRWHLAPAHTPLPHDLFPPDVPAHSLPPGPAPGPAGDGAAKTRKFWTLQRLRARTLPPRSWQITQAAGSCLLRSASCRPATRTADPHAQDEPQRLDRPQRLDDALPRPQADLAAPAPP
ncbi:hypothetical protein J4729_22010 [Leisingera sp. HS039]|uniref:hypothetical protein n=1 Tax=unclassified Leisingera TaxID=2614906 RepID=UPI00197E7812|nr:MULTISPECIES: hypothetical protein [unclassified Leisingera]MBQ4827198.1 hypothetical protein [Leisingera sp. HS039]